MKKIITVITASLVISGFAYGQDPATPNAGFENWTLVGSRYDPDNWNNLNPSTAILGVYTCTRATGVDKLKMPSTRAVLNIPPSILMVLLSTAFAVLKST